MNIAGKWISFLIYFNAAGSAIEKLELIKIIVYVRGAGISSRASVSGYINIFH
jgi:hypothetical protein